MTPVMAIAVVLLVISGILVYVHGDSTPGSSRARLESAVLAADSAVTADITLDLKAGFDGVTFAATGTGAIDFATGAMSLQLSVLGRTVALVESNRIVYLRLGSLVSSRFPGKTWLRIPVSTFSSPGVGGLPVTDDPRRMMSALLDLGASVTPIGTVSIDGTQDQAFRIHLTAADLKAHASALPSSLRPLFTTSTTLPQSARVSATMYVDPAGQLQAVHVGATAQHDGQSTTATVDLTMSGFGTASVGTPPPSTATVTYQRVEKTLGAGSLTFGMRGGTRTA
jgi:hypothetical protein